MIHFNTPADLNQDNYIVLEHERNVLPVDLEEVASCLRLDRDYDKDQLAMEILRATALIEERNRYALIHKTIQFTHCNPTIPLPLGPVDKILSVQKLYKGKGVEVLEDQYERIVRGEDHCICILKSGLSQKELEACGLADSTTKKTYYKESHMSFVVQYSAGFSVKEEEGYHQNIERGYHISKKIPQVFKSRIIEILEMQMLYTRSSTSQSAFAQLAQSITPQNTAPLHLPINFARACLRKS